MITFHPGFFARECPESEAEAVIAAGPNATHATGDYYNIKRAPHRALKGHSTVFNITFIISNFAHLHINQKILRKINPLFSFFSVYRILSN